MFLNRGRKPQPLGRTCKLHKERAAVWPSGWRAVVLTILPLSPYGPRIINIDMEIKYGIKDLSLKQDKFINNKNEHLITALFKVKH